MTKVLTDGVTIRDDAGKPVQVIIELTEVEAEADVAALLARAWAQLGQAISANKPPASPEPSREEPKPEPDQDESAEKHAPGTGAWWSE
jgi:hypothetical protein